MSRILALCLYLCLCLVPSFGHDGIDISIYSGAVDASTWDCVKKSGRDWAVIQAWDCKSLNAHVADNVKAAKHAGLDPVDVYVFMSNGCDSDYAGVVDAVHKEIAGSGFGKIWFDIEQCSGCWGSADANIEYMTNAAKHAKSLGIDYGVYSSEGEWPQVMGSNKWSEGGDLWYADWDSAKNFDDGGYKFGGWSKAGAKQYSGNTNLCGLSVDLDWY
jgi:GH25 family lysozyme M1 (1,4-beta-N-acetylmuramidase)